MLISTEALIFGFTQGFVIGPLTLYGIREGLTKKHGFGLQMQVVLGSALVDSFYLFLATKGVANFVDIGGVKLIMWSIAAYMLIHMGINSLHEKEGKMTFHHFHGHKLHFYETDFFKAILITLVNPMAIVFCILVVGSLYATYSGPVGPGMFAMNVNIGGLVSSTMVAALTLLVKQTFHPWMLKKLVKVGSMVLIGYGIYFSWNAINEVRPMIDQLSAWVGGI